jgi:Tfp pilus assembly protein PilF
MRTYIYRSVLAVAVALAVSAPAYAQNIVTGSVNTPAGEGIPGASVTLTDTRNNRTFEATTDADGQWSQIAVPAGPYNISIVAEGVGQAAAVIQIPTGRSNFDYVIGGDTGGDGGGLGALAARGNTQLEAGDNEGAIATFTEILAEAPGCDECHYNIGLAHMALRQYEDAEASFQQVVTLDPMSVNGFNGLASVYNATRQFDRAAEASARASELAGADPAASGSADAIYNQGVIFFNAGQMAEAQTQFQNTLAVDPNYADAYFQLGMASLNLGQIPAALEAFEGYLEVAPDGPRAAEVQGFVQQLGAIQ